MAKNSITYKMNLMKIGVVLIAALLVSCNSMFETFPKDELLEEDFWLSGGDVEAAVMTCYYDLRMCQDELILYGLVRSDIVASTLYECKQWQKGVFSSTDKICNWGRWYSLINDVNLVLKKSEAVLELDAAFSEEKYNQLMAEARFFRAFAYFNMIRMWKNIPIVTEPSLVDGQDYFPAKSNDPSEVFALIKEDLEIAIQSLPEEYIIENDKEWSYILSRGRVTVGAAYALLSDVHLWLGEYEECITACDQILNSPMYELVSAERWFDIFDPQKGNTSESVWELNYEETFDYTDRHNNSRWKYSLEEWFKDRLKTQPVSAVWVQPDFRIFTLTGSSFNQVRKHVGTSMAGSGVVDQSYNPNWIIYRLPHIMFNKAEALNRAIGGSAIDEINSIIYQLELRAGAVEFEQLSGSIKEVEENILRYKMKETAFEGTRWFDLKRIGTRQWSENITGEDNVLIRSITAAVAENDQIFVKGNLNNPEAWNIPIAKDELEVNKNLVQNPFYENN